MKIKLWHVALVLFVVIIFGGIGIYDADGANLGD